MSCCNFLLKSTKFFYFVMHYTYLRLVVSILNSKCSKPILLSGDKLDRDNLPYLLFTFLFLWICEQRVAIIIMVSFERNCSVVQWESETPKFGIKRVDDRGSNFHSQEIKKTTF